MDTSGLTDYVAERLRELEERPNEHLPVDPSIAAAVDAMRVARTDELERIQRLFL